MNKTASLNVLVVGSVERTSSLNVALTGTSTRTSSVDVDTIALPTYRYMRLRGDHLTRYFGGNPSDGNFFEAFAPAPSATVTNGIGWFGVAQRYLTYHTPNTIPTSGTFDKYSLPLASPIATGSQGVRIIVCFDIVAFGPNGSFVCGLFDGTASPVADITAGRLLAVALEAEQDHLHLRGWFGTAASSRAFASGLPLTRFIGSPLLLEIETVASGPAVANFRLFERAVNLDVPLISFALTGVATPTANNFSVTSLGRRTAELPANPSLQQFRVHYVDVEPPLGSNYAVPPTGMPLADAKWRPADDRVTFLLRQEGANTIYLAVSEDGVVASDEQSETITVDSADPIIEVLSFYTESSIIAPNTTNPPVVKGSLNAGYDDVSITWRADKTGSWTLRVDSTGVVDGIEIASGTYPVANVPVVTSWNFQQLPQIDAIYDVTLYLVSSSGKPTAKKLGEYLLP